MKQGSLIRKDRLTLILILLIILAIPLTLFLLSRPPSDQRSRAAHAANEAESGVRSGSVTVGNDTSASGGQFVQFGP